MRDRVSPLRYAHARVATLVHVAQQFKMYSSLSVPVLLFALFSGVIGKHADLVLLVDAPASNVSIT